MEAKQILPSDKNEVEYFADMSEDGKFELSLPLTDGNRRERRLTLLHFQTEGPFIPSSVQKLYDASENNLGIKNEYNFYMVDVDPKQLFKSNTNDNFKDFTGAGRWKNFSEILEKYRAGSMDRGLVINSDYLQGVMQKFWSDSVESYFDYRNYVQVFAELGTKLTESDLNQNDFNIERIIPDRMKMYIFPINFFYPLVTQTEHAGSTELDVGTIPSFNYDESLRSMIRYALIDINKGDIRSAFQESKRSAYLEYQVSEGLTPEKVETKYIFVWSMGNPFFFDVDTSDKPHGHTFRFLYSKRNQTKINLYGRHGSYVNMVGNDDRDVRGQIRNTYLQDFFVDLGYVMATASIYDSSKENLLMNAFRSNWGFIFAGALTYVVENPQEIEGLGYKLEDIKKNINDYNSKMINGQQILSLMCGTLSIIGNYITNIRAVSIFNKPSNISFYGPDLILRLMCDQVQTIVSGSRKRKNRLVQHLATIITNEQTYQSFNGVDNRVVLQPPTFRPLLFQQQEQSLLVGSSSRILSFYLINSNDEPVKFPNGEKVYIRFKIEPA